MPDPATDEELLMVLDAISVSKDSVVIIPVDTILYNDDRCILIRFGVGAHSESVARAAAIEYVKHIESSAALVAISRNEENLVLKRLLNNDGDKHVTYAPPEVRALAQRDRGVVWIVCDAALQVPNPVVAGGAYHVVPKSISIHYGVPELDGFFVEFKPNYTQMRRQDEES